MKISHENTKYVRKYVIKHCTAFKPNQIVNQKCKFLTPENIFLFLFKLKKFKV